MKMPINCRITNDCELATCDLPKRIRTIFDLSDKMFASMRAANKRPPRIVRIPQETMLNLTTWAKLHLNVKGTPQFLWRGWPVIGPHDEAPSHEASIPT